jgi:DNA replication protein DnaC
MDVKQEASTARARYEERKKERGNIPIPPRQDEREKIFNDVMDLMIPPAYQEYDLATLKPDTTYCKTPVVFQQFVIDTLRKNPTKGYAFFGPPGCGKTTMKSALLREAIRRNAYSGVSSYRPLYSTKMPQWMIDMEEAKFNRAPQPQFHHGRALTNWKNSQARSQYFLDEFDKCSSQEFINLTVMEFIDTLSEMGDKTSLVICTNMKYDEFLGRFGDHITRRIEKMCQIVDYHTATGE